MQQFAKQLRGLFAAGVLMVAASSSALGQAAEDPERERALVNEVSERGIARAARTVDSAEIMVESSIERELDRDLRRGAEPVPEATPMPVPTAVSMQDLEDDVANLERSIGKSEEQGDGR